MRVEFKSNDKENNDVKRFYKPDLIDVATNYISDSSYSENLNKLIEDRLRQKESILMVIFTNKFRYLANFGVTM